MIREYIMPNIDGNETSVSSTPDVYSILPIFIILLPPLSYERKAIIRVYVYYHRVVRFNFRLDKKHCLRHASVEKKDRALRKIWQREKLSTSIRIIKVIRAHQSS